MGGGKHGKWKILVADEMPIARLAESTVRVLGATQTLTDPASVVKELVDNALDANATSVLVEISSNTLDVAQVRDSGYGIAPEDRPAVARPHCTSKITCNEDLRDIGGSSLGFRGEALASVAQVGTLTVSTRVEGEQVATALTINQQGEVVSEARASLPIGTTVRVTDFVSRLIVRRQQALKNAEKSLRSIKHTLQAYAFARPNVRFSLRVLHGKNDKDNWMYAPKVGGVVADAALKIVGTACASQCVLSSVEAHGFMMQAFVPRVDADTGKISGVGAYLSVDARPVNATKGIFKQIVKVFRDTLKNANSSFNGIKEPFLYLEITCPSASYDANVEPAKDDLIFANHDDVMETAKQLFSTVYPVGDRQCVQPVRMLPRAEPRPDSALSENDGFTTALETPRSTFRHDQLLFRAETLQDPTLTTLTGRSGNGTMEGSGLLSRPKRSSRTEMHGVDILDMQRSMGRNDPDFDGFRQSGRDTDAPNPWVIVAKKSTFNKPTRLTEAAGLPVANDATSTTSSPSRSLHSLWDQGVIGLPTPRASSPHPQLFGFYPANHMTNVHPGNDSRLIDAESVHNPSDIISLRSACDEAIPADRQLLHDLPAVHDYALLSSQAGIPVSGTPIATIPEKSTKPRRSQRKQQGTFNHPFKTPLKDHPQKEKAWFDHLENAGRSHRKGKSRHEPRDSTRLVRQEELGDLMADPRPLTAPRNNHDIREFIGTVDLTGDDPDTSMIERRNHAQQMRVLDTTARNEPQSANENRKLLCQRETLDGQSFILASDLDTAETCLGTSGGGLARQSKRRKTSERHALQEMSGNGSCVAADDHGDYPPANAVRTVFCRRKSSSGKVLRTKSSRLPLERIPAGQGIYHFISNIATSTREIACSAGKIDGAWSLSGYSEPAVGSHDAFASVLHNGDVLGITAKLHDLLVNKVCDGEMTQDLGGLVHAAFASWDSGGFRQEEDNVDAMPIT